MKIVVKESQINSFVEENMRIEYTSEKVDEFVREGDNYLNVLKRMYAKLYNRLLSLSVGEVMENPESFKNLVEELTRNDDFIENLTTKYYNAIDPYPYGEYPENIKKLDEIKENIEDVQRDLQSVTEIYRAVYESVEHFIKWNPEKFK